MRTPKTTRTHYRVEWNEQDTPRERDGFTTRGRAQEWSDRNITARGLGRARIRSYQARKVGTKWQR